MARKQPAEIIVLKMKLFPSLSPEGRQRLTQAMKEASEIRCRLDDSHLADLTAAFQQIASVMRRARASNSTQGRTDVD